MRTWKSVLSPKYLHDTFGIYQGMWMPQMDRCWLSDDGYSVTSRILNTSWGKVEHVAITYNGSSENYLSSDGSRDISWNIKQEIKNELFGKNRLAIEVFPEEDRKIDLVDVYHLWVFPKGFKIPFGIHPKDTQCSVVNRGTPKDITGLVNNSAELLQLHNIIQ